MINKNTNLIWIDLEMTGLNPLVNKIIEIATIVTDAQLNILAEGPIIAIHQSNEIMDNLDKWNQHYHSKSGLIDRVKASKINEQEATKITLDFLTQYSEKGKSPICGNSICQDRRFLANYMPELESFFHYRNLDVSTIKELVNRWYPEKSFEKQSTHQALNDIKDSINELIHYRKHIFIS